MTERLDIRYEGTWYRFVCYTFSKKWWNIVYGQIAKQVDSLPQTTIASSQALQHILLASEIFDQAFQVTKVD